LADRQTRKLLITARRREQILHAALEVFSRKGFTAATIPEIARLAGLAAGTIYIYYPNKRELFVAVIEKLMMIPLADIFAGGSEKEFPLILQQAVSNRLSILYNVPLTRLVSLMGEIQRDPVLKTLFVNKLLGPFISKMEEMYRIRMAAGEIRSIEPALAVRLMAGMMIGLTILSSLENDSSPLRRLPDDKLQEEIMAFILYGLTGAPKEKKQ
jgi:AcrR family transcriptional regulator